MITVKLTYSNAEMFQASQNRIMQTTVGIIASALIERTHQTTVKIG